MSRRLDIELTSRRDDGSCTWRAAGAREPKGTVDGSLVPEGVAIGDVLRAELEMHLDGAEVLSITPPKAKRPEPDRIEIIGRPVRDDELVVEHRAPRGKGRGGRDGDRGRRDGDRRGGGGRGRDRERDGGGRGEGGDRGDRAKGAKGGRRSFTPPPPVPERPKPKRLRPKRTHRGAAIAALPEEQRPIAEQVLRGGIPAVRQAIEKQNEAAAASGGEQVEAKGLVALAEQLLPSLRVAEWRDRAEAALADLDELDLRDLRSVVAAAEQGARDEESKAQAEALRVGLARRVEEEHVLWLEELTQLVAIGRIARALRVAARPPKAGSRLPEPLGAQLAEAAGASMTAETGQERYATMIDAVSTSPVCARVTPVGVPAEPTPALRKAAKRAAKRCPGIAAAFGLGGGAPTPAGGKVPPPPPSAAPIPPPPTIATPAPEPAAQAATEPVSAPAAPAEPAEVPAAVESEPTPEPAAVEPEPTPEPAGVEPEPVGAPAAPAEPAEPAPEAVAAAEPVPDVDAPPAAP